MAVMRIREGKCLSCAIFQYVEGDHVSSDEELNPRWRTEKVHEVQEEKMEINK